MRPNILSLLVILLISTPLPALCCSTLRFITDDEYFANASSVFAAHIYRTEEIANAVHIGGDELDAIAGDFRVLEVFKGEPPKDGKVHDFEYGPGNCGLGLYVGMDYIFFINDSGDGAFFGPEADVPENLVITPTGSQMLDGIGSHSRDDALNYLRALQNDQKSKK